MTGTALVRNPDAAAVAIGLVIGSLDDATEFTTGGAHGVDSMAARAGFLFFKDRRVIQRLIYPEALPWNQSLLVGDPFDQVNPIPGDYMARNDALVAACDVLLAFPKTAVEELRSGTWATVRRARKANKIVRVYSLGG